MNLIDTKSFDFVKQTRPQWFYKRVQFDLNQEVAFELEYGFNFLLRGVVLKGESFNLGQYTNLRIELIRDAFSRELQNEPIPDNLYTSPGSQDGQYTPAPAPVDNEAFGVNGNAVPVKSIFKVNEIYHYSEAVRFKLSWEALNASGKFADIIAKGYYIPENVNSVWG